MIFLVLYINHSKKLTIWLWTLLFRQSSRLQDHGKNLTWSVFELQSIKTQGPKYFHSVQTFFLTLKFLFGYTKTNLPAVLVISSIYKIAKIRLFPIWQKKRIQQCPLKIIYITFDMLNSLITSAEQYYTGVCYLQRSLPSLTRGYVYIFLALW